MSKKKSYDIEPNPVRSQDTSHRYGKLSWIVFILTTIVVLLSLSSVVFPALLIRSTSSFHGVIATPEFVSPLEPGILAIPLIMINLIVFGIGFAYYRKKIERITSMVNKISNIELTKKQALIGVIVLLAIFITITTGTLTKEETWADYSDVKHRVQIWDISQFTKSSEPHIRYLLLSASLNIFSNIRIIPFLASISLLLLTYFFTKNITQKRFAGFIAMALLLQSQIFVSYGTTASYDNFWILFYLFSLFLIQKFWQASPISYILSIFSKSLTIEFLPMNFYFIARSALSMKQKLYASGTYGAVFITLLTITYYRLGIHFTATTNSFDASQFWQGFSAMAMQMRFDYIIVLFLLPLTVMLFFASRRRVLHADSILISILTILLTAPFLLSFTDQTNQPYRFVSLSVFFAIGVGVLLSKRTRKQDELQSSMK